MEEVYLSVVIPAYNEEKRIEKTLREIDEYLKKQNYSYEILVVDDGSKDKTKEIVENLSSEIKNLKCLSYGKNEGKGFAVRFGMLNAKGKFRLFSDADHSTPIWEIEKFFKEFEKGADVVVASRELKESILQPPQGPWRRFLGEGFKILRKIILDLWEIEDTQCGFKCFKKEVVEKIFPKCKINRFAFDPEILILAKKEGYKIKEVPVLWRNDPQSKVKFKSIFNMFLDLFKIRYNLLTKKYAKI